MQAAQEISGATIAPQSLRNRYYISSGKKNAQYTLRVRLEEWGCNEYGQKTMLTRDQYVCNLGINLARATEKAEEVAGERVVVECFDLNAYGEADREAAAAREANKMEEEAVQARLDADHAEKMRKRREEDAKSQWQGTIGERITRELTCLRWIPIGEGTYGTRYVAIFRDAEFNKYIFFGGCALTLPDNGDTAKVTFTVVEHGERDGCKQTIIKKPAKAKLH